jgi:predicted transcriptional regulator
MELDFDTLTENELCIVQVLNVQDARIRLISHYLKMVSEVEQDESARKVLYHISGMFEAVIGMDGSDAMDLVMKFKNENI